MCGLYEKTEAMLIETKVNEMFGYVKFKLFKQHLNGNIEPVCVTIMDGVPYKDNNPGKQINAWVDIKNTLTPFYGISLPMFIDGAESITDYFIEPSKDYQTILIIAKPDIDEVKIEIEKEIKQAVNY